MVKLVLASSIWRCHLEAARGKGGLVVGRQYCSLLSHSEEAVGIGERHRAR